MQAKVHQKALLAAGLVDGPADPRLPTLRGLMRAGCHPDALKAFLLEQVGWIFICFLHAKIVRSNPRLCTSTTVLALAYYTHVCIWVDFWVGIW